MSRPARRPKTTRVRTPNPEQLRLLQKDLEGMYRLQCFQMTLLRNLQRELRGFAASR